MKESNKISVTNQDGKFELKVPKGQSNYEIEYKEYSVDKMQTFTFSNPEVCQKIRSNNETSEVTLGAAVVSYYKSPTILRKVGRTISWPFRQIGLLFN